MERMLKETDILMPLRVPLLRRAILQYLLNLQMHRPFHPDLLLHMCKMTHEPGRIVCDSVQLETPCLLSAVASVVKYELSVQWNTPRL